MVIESRQRPASLQAAGVLLVILALITAFWWPTLFEGKTLIHGDSIVHGLPLMDLHSRALHGDASVLWSERIYGGHPIFAEGQGGFAHPLNILFAALVPPVYGHNLFHFVCMLLLAGGTYGLCRALGASVFAAGFGALAAAFAPVCTGAQQNLTISGTMTWIPWTLWAFEVWLRRPDALRAVFFGAACCLLLLAGYPQLFHGTVVYMAASLLVLPLQPDGRRQLTQDWRRLLASGVLAVLFCIGLAAVQLLPLLELTTHSHRSQGVGLIPFLPMQGLPYWRGFLYSLTSGTVQPADGYSNAIGSLLVCAAAALVLVVKTPPRIKGHLLATLLLVQLGIGMASPFFRLVYEHGLIPGLNFFRTMWAYLNIAAVGFAVLAALGMDNVAARLPGAKRGLVFAVAGVFAALGAAAAVYCYAPGLPWWNAASALLALAGVLLLMLLRRALLIPLLLFALLAFECLTLHLQEFDFASTAVLAPPHSAPVLAQQSRLEDFKFMDRTQRPGYVFLSPRRPDLPELTPILLASYSAMTNLLFDVPSVHGALALPLKARALLDQLLIDETDNLTAAHPGQRAIDLLSVRYVTALGAVERPGFRLATVDEKGQVAFMENTAAKPRFQTYTRYVAVPSTEAAVALVRQPRDEALILETTVEPAAANAPVNDPQALQFTVTKAGSTYYAFEVDARQAGWLFVADANYPGWKARVDGIDTPVYSANVLGKAVAVTAGKHRVELYFESTTFRVGLIATLLSLVAAAAIAWRAWRQRISIRQHSSEGIA